MPDSLRPFKAEFFRALAHPTRIAIIEQLRNGELSAGGVARANEVFPIPPLPTKVTIGCLSFVRTDVSSSSSSTRYVIGRTWRKVRNLDFHFYDLLDDLLTSSDAFIHAGSNVMKTLRSSTPNG